MFNLGEKIKILRKNKKITQDDLAEKLNVSKQTLFMYENEKRLIPIDVLANVAKVFSVPIESFFSETDIFNNVTFKSDFKRIPIISEVSAGKGEFGRDDILDWLEMPSSLCSRCEYGTFVKGDSMEPKILDGDLILIHKTDVIDNGSVGIFRVGENVFCKKYFANPITKEVVLKSINPKYDSIRITESFHEDFYILGKVVCKIDYNF